MDRRRVLMLAAVLFVAVTSGGCGYNTLVGKQQNVRRSWADVESRLQRRADLIPNLFEAARAAGIQEQEVFGQIAEARSRLLNATGAPPAGEGGDRTPEQREQIIQAANSFGGTLGRLLSLQEAYPDLKSNQAFLNFQAELAGTENRINVAREDYNAAVQDYNTTRGSFPTVLGAKLYGFKEEPFFRADASAREVPKINSESLRRNPSGQTAPAK